MTPRSGLNKTALSAALSPCLLYTSMLVDNSIVVIENIYRLRSLGVPASKAALQGAKQVSGALFASTLTTICVFLPLVFTQGISRELFTDMGLTIAYSLLASLVVAPVSYTHLDTPGAVLLFHVSCLPVLRAFLTE